MRSLRAAGQFLPAPRGAGSRLLPRCGHAGAIVHSPGPEAAPGRRLVAVLLAALAVAAAARPSAAADKTAPAKAAGVFDDAEASTPREKPAAKPKEGGVSDRDTIGFTQENVASQMTELEERMFRLSEALQGLEPENASRLRLALKFSREELILQQMKETQALLKEAQLSKAETEARELLAKLEHLRSLLLAEDLDFQMKLAKLRQMKEALGRLDRIIKEERRELAWSRNAFEQKKEIERLGTRRPDLESLAKEQEKVVADAGVEAVKGDGEAAKEARAALRKREAGVRAKAASLAADPLFALLQPPHLKQADTPLADAQSHLDGGDVGEAGAAAGRALELFRKELGRLDHRVEVSEKVIAAGEFRRFEREQARNRGAADSLGQASARLGDVGVSLQKDLIRAGASMRSAEGELAKSSAIPAADHQTAAIDQLGGAREDLARAVEALLVELRSELQARLHAELAEMHELQASIRETTEAQAPRVARKSRTALIVVAGLSQQESELAERTDHLLALVEETDYGIALPTSLRVLSREMKTVRGWLKAGDTSDQTIALERRIEEDLIGLLEAMRRLPPTTRPRPGDPLPDDLMARERELNRLIAELKMIRMLQVRLNDDTVHVDKSRPGTSGLPAPLRREIEALELSQDEIRDSLAKISERKEAEEQPDQ